ncbi:hypothetical protein HXX76_000432 [Chlamydomonas incerta]|uniref:TLC domain-containing protein n=1 Tax=Chlamydomonas incerta TaxID=51695 RepID=A0A835WEB5_CHLIN|nr:hypothetical protein HXX76_000432 [Chlamydomonas incerta]|eukprot:KAG2445828.1 hypothetical protein HXX76_000432 [Chlamydomonas incerta]
MTHDWQLRYLLFRYDALRLIAPRDDAEYEAWFAVRARDLAAYNQIYALLAPSLLLCAGLCLLRVAFVRGVLIWADAGATSSGRCCAATAEGKQQKALPGAAGSIGKDGGDAGYPAAAVAADLELRWAEGFWTAAGGTVLLVWSWKCVMSSNGGCPGLPGLLDTSACLAGWPQLPTERAVRRYYSAELAWYLHLLLKHHLGVGLHDSGLMVVHHVATVYLLLLSYCFSLTRAGVLLLALLNLSSPLLHVSKIAHASGSKRLALVSFASFAAVFAASRVVLFPLIFLPLGLISSQRHIRRLLQLYPFTFGIINTLLVALVAMQFAWFVAIVRIIRQAASGDAARLARSAATMEVVAAAAATGGSAGSSDDAAVVVARHSQGFPVYKEDAVSAEVAGEDGGGGAADEPEGLALAGRSTGSGADSSTRLAASASAAVAVGRSRPAAGAAAASDAAGRAPAAGTAARCTAAAAWQAGASSGKRGGAVTRQGTCHVHASSASGAAATVRGTRVEPLLSSPGGSCGMDAAGAAGGAGAGRAAQLSSCGLSDGVVTATQHQVG